MVMALCSPNFEAEASTATDDGGRASRGGDLDDDDDMAVSDVSATSGTVWSMVDFNSIAVGAVESTVTSRSSGGGESSLSGVERREAFSTRVSSSSSSSRCGTFTGSSFSSAATGNGGELGASSSG